MENPSINKNITNQKYTNEVKAPTVETSKKLIGEIAKEKGARKNDYKCTSVYKKENGLEENQITTLKIERQDVISNYQEKYEEEAPRLKLLGSREMPRHIKIRCYNTVKPEIDLLVDSGCQLSLIKKSLLTKNTGINETEKCNLVGISGSLRSLGKTALTLKFGRQTKLYDFQVIADEGLKQFDGIIGQDIILNSIIDLKDNVFIYYDPGIKIKKYKYRISEAITNKIEIETKCRSEESEEVQERTEYKKQFKEMNKSTEELNLTNPVTTCKTIEKARSETKGFQSCQKVNKKLNTIESSHLSEKQGQEEDKIVQKFKDAPKFDGELIPDNTVIQPLTVDQQELAKKDLEQWEMIGMNRGVADPRCKVRSIDEDESIPVITRRATTISDRPEEVATQPDLKKVSTKNPFKEKKKKDGSEKKENINTDPKDDETSQASDKVQEKSKKETMLKEESRGEDKEETKSMKNSRENTKIIEEVQPENVSRQHNSKKTRTKNPFKEKSEGR
jgi:hypothetical protein